MNIINASMFIVLLVIAVAIEIRLSKSNLNGFKRILLGFFGSEIWVNILFVIFECTNYGRDAKPVTQCFILIAYLPKFFYKIKFYFYIKHSLS